MRCGGFSDKRDAHPNFDELGFKEKDEDDDKDEDEGLRNARMIVLCDAGLGCAVLGWAGLGSASTILICSIQSKSLRRRYIYSPGLCNARRGAGHVNQCSMFLSSID
jgi:hypothetical protein